ncbi:hypothetical protein CPB83DRAFT_882976 [Crepidotus variabilis]|uniref:Uncharacterized protein n=1 Tax=Crepidotus variabilis TaxID=179855 RepID=A0A9P6EHL6_9AGAR|nr:hypothetical protein CPB83DRAFT_882976 [Crepidotus variabilis]
MHPTRAEVKPQRSCAGGFGHTKGSLINRSSWKAPHNLPVLELYGKLLLQVLANCGSLPIRWGRIGLLEGVNSDPSIAFMVIERLLVHHWLQVLDEIQLLDVSSTNLLADVLSWYSRMGKRDC